MIDAVHLCNHCLFRHPACIGTPIWQYWVTEDGDLVKNVASCDAFIESKESKEAEYDGEDDDSYGSKNVG